ncbi:M20 family metallopeptidase [Collinsella tanakaei]|uniref:M20 family metallopeptidase n=1 Tax=Collinsella tanakaei TaxID=626935 RepID=UPI0025A40ACC|nr:M20 family metallopeptidase [Collinsella tanakaei]MDM8299385.1 M20 family metallopeptidase [Collinsella tanakaei]
MAIDKETLFSYVDDLRPDLTDMADRIFDNPEYDGKEYDAQALLTAALEAHGFAVERGVGGYETSFRAEYAVGEGGPTIGFLCEYDALVGLGHGCGHHMQGPAILGAAFAVQRALAGPAQPYKLVVYGTPAEETQGAKASMIKNGCFHELDVALMMHGSPTTCTDVRCLADQTFKVHFHGHRAHAALAPDQGRSAFDALLVAFNGIEFLREHVSDDTRMHYTVSALPGPSNVVPAEAEGVFSLRSFSKENLEGVVARFKDIIKGAALIAGVDYDIELKHDFYNKIPVLKLNELLMKNAELAGAPRLSAPREKTGSTDFGNVMYEIPGSCIRVAFVPVGTSSHSQEFVDAGKSDDAHNAVIYGAKTLAGAACDLICDPALMQAVKDEFAENKKANA